MIRKQKVLITLLCFLFATLIIPPVINIFFPRVLLNITYLSYLFVIPCIIIPFTSLGKTRIEYESKNSICKWFLSIIGIEIGAIALFINQSTVFIDLIYHNTLLTTQNTVLKLSFFNIGLFPWSIICAISICFYLSSKKNAFTPFGIFFPQLSNLFLTKVSHKAIDIFVQISTKLFISINIIFFIIQASLLFFPKELLLIPANGLVLGCFILLFYKRDSFKHLMQSINQKSSRQGIQFIIIFMLFTPLLLLTLFFMKKLVAWQPFVAEQQLIKIIGALVSSKLSFQLLCWSWWILGVPLLSSWIIKLSHGQTIRKLILAVFVLPVILCALHYFNINVTNIPEINIATCIVGIIFLLTLLLKKDAHQYLWFGFFPPKAPKKERRVLLDQIWILTIGSISILLLLGITSLQLIVMMIALPNLFIFIFNLTATTASSL